MAISWLGRENPRDPWENEVVWPIGDIEAAERIRSICRAAGVPAAVVARPVQPAVGNEKPFEAGLRTSEAERYQRAAKCAMETAMKMKDDLMRDVAVGEIVDLCVKTNDLKTAQILFRAIQAEAIRDKVRNAHPVLQG